MYCASKKQERFCLGEKGGAEDIEKHVTGMWNSYMDSVAGIDLSKNQWPWLVDK